MHEALWQKVELELDARRSPFDDPALAAALAVDPEAAAAVRRLLANLARLSPAVARARHAAPRRARTLAAAALLLGLASLAWRTRDTGGSAPARAGLTYETKLSMVVQRSLAPPARVARVELAPRRVLAWTLEGGQP